MTTETKAITLPTLEEIQALRAQMQAALQQQITKLKSEKWEMEAEYDREISELEGQLRMLGVEVPSIRRATETTEAAERIYRWLCEEPDWHTAGEIKANVRNIESVVVSIALVPYIESGKVERQG